MSYHAIFVKDLDYEEIANISAEVRITCEYPYPLLSKRDIDPVKNSSGIQVLSTLLNGRCLVMQIPVSSSSSTFDMRPKAVEYNVLNSISDDERLSGSGIQLEKNDHRLM